jgi:hypothetical protein
VLIFLETLGLFALTVLVAYLCGYGPVMLLLPNEYRHEFMFVLMPPIGYCTYSWFAFTLSGTLGLTGAQVTAIAAPIFILLALAAVFVRRPPWPSVRQVASALGLSVVTMVCILWPLFYVGAETYLGAVNPDYTATLYDIHFLESHPVSAGITKYTDSYGYFTDVAGGVGASARFGSSYFVLLVDHVLSVPMRTALTLCIGLFVFCLPLSVYFMARAAFGFSRRAAVTASALIGISAPASLSYIYFYVGQNSGLGVLPAVLALLYLVVTRPSWGTLALATLPLNGLYVMYTGMVPYAIAPVGFAALYLVVAREVKLGRSLALGLGIVAASVLLNLGNRHFLGAAFVGWNRLVGLGLQGQFFIDFLTEQFVPVFLGLVTYPLNLTIFGELVTRRFLICLYALSAVVVIVVAAIAVRGAMRSGRRGQVALALGAVLVYGSVWYVYTFHRQYGYAVFKMTSWMQFVYVLPLAYGLEHIGGEIRRSRSPARKALGVGVLAVLATVVLGNFVSTFHLSRLSLGHDTKRGKIVNSYDMSGNYDYLELAARLRQHVPDGKTVGISFVDSIQHEWVGYYLRDFRLSVLGHQIIPADDENLPDVVTRRATDYYGNAWVDHNFYFHGGSDDYYLTWNDTHVNQDIVERRLPAPVWESRSFRLLRGPDCRDFLYTGRGWYRLEFRDLWDWWWPARFRWTAEGGEIYMLRAGQPGRPYRLSFVAIVGHGLASERRTVELWHNVEKFDEVEINGTGRVVSKPFFPTGEVDRLVLKVRERVRPMERTIRLWNRDLPRDYRRLNLLVGEVKVLPPGNHGGRALRKLEGEALFSESYSFDGLEPNRWVGESLSIAVHRPEAARSVELSLWVASTPAIHFPLTIQGAVDGAEVLVSMARPGRASKVVPLGPATGDGLTTIQLTPHQSYVPMGADMENRPVHESFRLESITFGP